MDFSTLLISSLLIILLTFFINRNNFLKRKKGLKIPPATSIWKMITKRIPPHIFLTQTGESLGPIFSMKLGSRLLFVASTMEAAREIYKLHDRELSGRFNLQVHRRVAVEDSTLIAMAGECNKRWKLLRDVIHSELFSSPSLESQSQVRVEKVQEMMEYLRLQEGKVVTISDVVFTTLANSLSMSMTSRDMIHNWENIEEAKTHMRGLPLFARPGIGDLYPCLAWIDHFSNKRKWVQYNKIYTTLWGDVLSQRKKSPDGDPDPRLRPDLIDRLIKSSWKDTQIFEFLSEMFASMETTTTAIEWVMAELTRNKEAFDKVREELLEVSEGGRVLQEANLTKLSYFQACIKETLRLHPPLPVLAPRAAVQSCKLMNYDVPKGCIIITNAYALGRDSNTWKDPLVFNPERFLGPTSFDVKGSNYQFLPFGSGIRICSGYPWALKHIQLIVASMVLAYDWSIPGLTDPSHLNMDEKFGNVLLKDKTLQLLLKNRINVRVE